MKPILFLAGAMLFFTHCTKDASPFLANDDIQIESRSPKDKIQICHSTGSETNPYEIIEVHPNAAAAHYNHGDINSDMDGDGYTAPFGVLNPCHLGSGDDCDDTNASIHPGAEEICGDGVDNNCNGFLAEETAVPEIDPDCPCINRKGACRPMVDGECPGRTQENYSAIITCEDITPVPVSRQAENAEH